jgi:hypothetical protein
MMHGGEKSDLAIVCAGQRPDREGSSPSGARMRGAVSKSGGNASLAEVSGRYGDVVCCERAVPVRDGRELYRRWGTAPRSRPAGVGFKPPQAARVKSPGGERCWKRRKLFRQVGLEETNASEPLKTCRNILNRRRNRDRTSIP